MQSKLLSRETGSGFFLKKGLPFLKTVPLPLFIYKISEMPCCYNDES